METYDHEILTCVDLLRLFRLSSHCPVLSRRFDKDGALALDACYTGHQLGVVSVSASPDGKSACVRWVGGWVGGREN
jgi:hypothetical protein